MQNSIGQVVWMQVFNKFHLFKIYESFTFLLWNINNFKSVKKIKNILIKKKSVYYCTDQTHFGQ